jgi:hypothetical protein
MVFVTFLGVALLASYFPAQAKRQTNQAIAQPGNHWQHAYQIWEVKALHAFVRHMACSRAIPPYDFLISPR